MITTMYDSTVNSAVPVDMNVIEMPYSYNAKIGINDVNEKSSSLAEEKLFPKNSWRGLSSGAISINGVIDRRLYAKTNLITKALMDAFMKSPNSKLIVNEVNGAKYYDIISVSYQVKNMISEEIRSDVNTTVKIAELTTTSSLVVNDSTGLYNGMFVKVFVAGDTGDYEFVEIKSIIGKTNRGHCFKEKT